eukprot:scaffold4097_cov166-Amphora_coffeaeformis.AAC.29
MPTFSRTRRRMLLCGIDDAAGTVHMGCNNEISVRNITSCKNAKCARQDSPRVYSYAVHVSVVETPLS